MDLRTPDTQNLTGRRRGWTKVVVDLRESAGHIPHLLKRAHQRQWQLVSLAKFLNELPKDLVARGAIVETLASDPRVRTMLDRGIAVVRIGHWPNNDDHLVPAVVPDMPAVGVMAADYFAKRDFKHLAFLGREPWGINEPLFTSFAARAAELGCACHLVRLRRSDEHQGNPGDTSPLALWAGRQDQFIELLRPLPKPLGLLAIGDRHADRYCYWTTEAGLRVPEDVAVMGVGNEEFICEAASPPLSSVAQDHERTALAAVELLDQLMAGKTPDATTVRVAPLGVVTRQSTDVLAASDPMVVRALRFMWDHVSQDLAVDDIAHHVGASRRTLEKAFNRDLGRGINAEFQRRRLEKVGELLIQTDLNIAGIARTLNYSGPKYLAAAFTSAYGMSPTRYRRRHRSQIDND